MCSHEHTNQVSFLLKIFIFDWKYNEKKYCRVVVENIQRTLNCLASSYLKYWNRFQVDKKISIFFFGKVISVLKIPTFLICKQIPNTYLYIFFVFFLVTKKANSHKMTPFNTARSDSHKTEIFENVSNEYKSYISVTPVITGMFIVFSER